MGLYTVLLFVDLGQIPKYFRILIVSCKALAVSSHSKKIRNRASTFYQQSQGAPADVERTAFQTACPATARGANANSRGATVLDG